MNAVTCKEGTEFLVVVLSTTIVLSLNLLTLCPRRIFTTTAYRASHGKVYFLNWHCTGEFIELIFARLVNPERSINAAETGFYEILMVLHLDQQKSNL